MNFLLLEASQSGADAGSTTNYTVHACVCTENITGEGGERAAMDRIVEEGEAMEDLYNKHSSSSLKIVLQQPQRQPQQRRISRLALGPSKARGTE